VSGAEIEVCDVIYINGGAIIMKGIISIIMPDMQF
jgi:hypothetical protein